MLKNILVTVILSLMLVNIVIGRTAAMNTSEVDLALEAVGTGSAEEMGSRIFTTPVTVLGTQHRAQAIAALPDQIRKHRITEGKLLRRVETVMKPVLQLDSQNEDVELFLYHGEAPRGMLVQGCLLVLSDSLADPLKDVELAGIIAHELGHRYFMDEMLAAREAEDEQMMRVVELQCDAVAMLSLKLLGYDPSLYLRGLKRLEMISKEQGYSVRLHGRSHPTTVERAQLAERLNEQLD